MVFRIGNFVLFLSLLITVEFSCKTAGKTQKAADLPTAESIKKAMSMALDWQEAHPIFAKSPTDWTNGAYYTGVARAHAATGERKYFAALENQAITNKWLPWERFYHADDMAICFSYLYLNSIGAQSVDLKPTEKIIEDHLHKPHAWKEGKGNKEQVILWWWCDALFMAPPVLANYAKLKNSEKYLDEMHRYYVEAYGLLYDQKDHLWARDNRFLWKGTSADLKEANGEKIYWSRGNGWVLGGLALLLESMPKNYIHREFYSKLFKEMANRVKAIQQPDGLWYTSLLSPESFKHGETSGSGFFTFALAWGINSGILPASEYRSAVGRAWKALLQVQQADGKVGWVQNIGFDPKPADKDSWQNYGTGAFLMAGSEVLKMK